VKDVCNITFTAKSGTVVENKGITFGEVDCRVDSVKKIWLFWMQ